MHSYFASTWLRFVQETGVEMELEENMPLLEWLANNYKTFGAQLEIITDRSVRLDTWQPSTVRIVAGPRRSLNDISP